MAEYPIKAFLSCSFAEEDRPLVDLFQRLLRAVRITPEVHQYQQVARLSTQLDEHIKACDCLIAIATRRDRLEEAGVWTFSDWVHDEVAIARALGKPIALFVEEGVRIGGSLPADVPRQAFVRTNLLEGIDAIVGFLFNLREHLDHLLNHRSQISNLKLLRELIHVRERFTRNEFSCSCEIAMESLVDDLPAAYHSQVLFDDTPGLSVRPWEFDFKCSEAPDGVKAIATTTHASDRRHVWVIAFDPPLKERQRVRYGFRLAYGNDQPYTFEDAQGRLERGTYPIGEARCRVLDWTINYPTRELNYEIEFPRGYRVLDPRLEVRIGTMGHVFADEECRRLMSGKAFVVEKVFDTWRARLHIQNPLFGHNYAISYVPPSNADLEKNSRELIPLGGLVREARDEND